MANKKVTLYTSSKLGMVGLFAGFLLAAIPFAHFVGGAPGLNELQVIEGKVIELETVDLPRSTRLVKLTVLLPRGGSTELSYGANRASGHLQAIEQTRGQTIRARATNGEGRVFDLEASGKKLIDYAEEDKGLRGNPFLLGAYWAVSLVTFVTITIIRKREVARTPLA